MHHKIPDDIRNILNIARLAPSSHNTQPWQVQISGNELIVGYDPARQLTVGDPDKRELFISLGCFIETIALAAPAYGYRFSVDFLGTTPDRVASINLRHTDSKAGQQQIEIIRSRRSDRRHYQDKPIPSAAIEEISNCKQGSAHISLFDDPKDIDFLAQMTYDATYKVMSDPAFRQELSGWVRHNWTKRPDGMPGYTQGIPGPISLFAKVVIRKNKKMAGSQAKMDSERVKHSAAIGLVSVSQDTPEAWLDAGRVYQRACLAATAHDLKTAGTSAAVIDSDTSEKIKKRLGLKGTAVALIRFGYTNSTPKAAPRRAVDDFAVTS
ncbi:MAG TPA: hypothetical protein VHA05_03935 [Candidatus Saccharimonadales bacterium]|nr:hypothetical protein [Candidatus Saccharimonadales bacterium]